MKTSKSWGVSPLKAEISTADYCCPKPGCGWGRDVKIKHDSLIGFSTNPPSLSRTGGEAGCCLVFECPHCFTKFWHHIIQEDIECWQRFFRNWPEESD